VSIEESSQFASALLLCAKIGGWEIEVVGENGDESSYVWMTTRLIIDFERRDQSKCFQIEPDESSASYFVATGWLFAADRVDSSTSMSIISRADVSLQIDSMFFNYFRYGGCVGLLDANSRCSSLSRLENLADSIMTAIVIASFVKYSMQFTDLGRLRLQETERVVALRTELTKCGAKVVEEGDTLTVWPSQLHGAEIETYNDHRMAMCFAILGLKVPGIKIKNPACVKKTFPNFFQKLAAQPPHGLGVEIRDAKTGRKLPVEELFAD
jgi:3-phosphoshikimate 1-carboxyvinyltransferase